MWAPHQMTGVEVPPDRPGLAVIKRVSVVEAEPGDTVTYVIFYRNMGNTPISNVSIVDSLLPRLEYVKGTSRGPEGTAFQHGDESASARPSCAGSFPACSPRGPSGTCRSTRSSARLSRLTEVMILERRTTECPHERTTTAGPDACAGSFPSRRAVPARRNCAREVLPLRGRAMARPSLLLGLSRRRFRLDGPSQALTPARATGQFVADFAIQRRAHRPAPSPLGTSRPAPGDRLHRHRSARSASFTCRD